MEDQRSEITLVDSARSLGISYQDAWNAVVRGDLKGRQRERGRWLVEEASVLSFAKRRRKIGATSDDVATNVDVKRRFR